MIDIITKDICILTLIKFISNYNPYHYEEIMKYLELVGMGVKTHIKNPLFEKNLNDYLLQLLNKPKFIDVKSSEKNKCIGVGGFGNVYQYENDIDKQKYAIKRVTISPSQGQYFNEVEILSKLDYKNIVKYHTTWFSSVPPKSIECSSEEDEEEELELVQLGERLDTIPSVGKISLNIQMELCLLNLNEFFNHRKQTVNFNTSDCYYISKEILDGIEYLHHQNIIHGDISSSNIFITSNFGIKIGDFGLSFDISKHSNSLVKEYNNDYLNLYTINKNDGNPTYRAPEVSEYQISKVSDIYSFGILLFEIFNNFKTHHQRNIYINKLKTRTILDKDIQSTILFNKSLIPFYIKLLYHLTHIKHNKRPTILQIKSYLFNFIIH
jgi:serine/threonine protein kinase